MSHTSRNNTAKSSSVTDERRHMHPSSSLSSIYPWYYVPGRSYLTEKNLSDKYRRESRRNQENEEINKYFMKCNSEVKLFSNWENNKPLVRYHHLQDEAVTPFDTEDTAKRDIKQSQYAKCVQKMAALFQQYDQSSGMYRRNYIDCNLAIKYLYEYMEIYKLVKEKRCLQMGEIQHYLKQGLYSSLRDPLRQVCFLIKEILYFYKKEIFNIMKLLKPLYRQEFLSEHELSELDKLNNRCFQIIDMYIQLNDIRNDHFQQMYNEEREDAWRQQKGAWDNEILVWDQLIVKLLNSNYLLIKEKLEGALNTQREHFQDRFAKFDQLTSYVNEIKLDTDLHSVLYKDISELSEK